MKKRIISFCLVLCMLLGYAPAGVLAADSEDFDENVEEIVKEVIREQEEPSTEEEPSEEPQEGSAPKEASTEAPAVPVVLTATAEDGIQVVLTAEAGAFTDGEVALTAAQLTLTAHVVTGLEAEAAQAEIDSANLIAAMTYDICVMYGGVELQPVPGKSVSVAFVVPTVPEEAEVVEVVHHDEEGKVETVVEKQEVDASAMVEVAPVVEELVNEVADEFTQETEAVVEETVAALPEEAVEVLTGTVPSFSYYTVVFTYEQKTALVDCATTKNDLTILSESVGIPLRENTAVISSAELYKDASCQGSAVESGIIRNDRGGDILRVYHDEQMKWYLDCVEEFEGSYGLKLTTDKGQVYTVTLQCAEQTERKAYIRSALTHETDSLRVSELLEVVALGFSPNADLEYKYEIKGNSGNTRYASLNIYNSMNQLEEYSGEWDSDATTNNSGVTPSGKNYRYFALQDKSNQTRCWNQDKCTVTVTVTNRNNRRETAIATYSGFESSNLKADVESTLLIVFVGEEQQITTLYGLNGVVHIDCSNSEVRDGRIEDTSIATCDDDSITGVSAGVTALTVTVEKDHDCDHHSVSNGQWAGTVAEACKNTVYVVNQPKVTGEGEITFEDVPAGVTITLNGVSLTSTDPSVPLVFKGLTPGESYTVAASVYDTGTKAEAITEAEIVVPDGKTEHTYIFVHQDVSGETLEGASVKIEPTTLIGDSKELRITPIPPEGYRATSAKGSYNIFIPIIPFIIPRTPSFVLQKDGSFVVDEGSMDPIGNITITITYEQHKHSWKYESAKTAADNDTIKAYCVNTGHTGVGTADNPDKVVISSQNWTYDGNGHDATLSQNSVGGVNGLTIQYQSWNGSTYVPMSGTPTNVGQYRASVAAGGVTAYTIYKIEALDLSELATAAGPAAKTYTGSSIKPTDVVVSYEGETLVLGTDYTLEYGENKDAGKGTVIVKFQGNYTGSLTQEFDILRKAVTVKADDKSVVAGESAPVFTAKVTGTVNEETVAYTLSCAYVPGESEAGEYAITPTGDATQGNYTVTFEAGKLIVSEAEVLVIVTSSAEYEGVYDGESHGSEVEVTGSDFVTVQYSTDGGETWSDDFPTITDVGEITVSVKATAPGCKDAETSYVLKVTAAPATVKAKDNGKTYDEADPALTAEVTGLFGTDKLTYTVERAEGEDVGTYAITASGDEEQGNYTVSYENGVFTIEAKDISETVTVDAIPDQTYTGELITPKPDVYDGDKKLTEGTDFVYEYTDEKHDNKTIGEKTGIVKVVFIGNYAGATSVEFAIVEGEQSYTVVYTYNGTLGSGPLTGGTGKYGEWTTVTADKQTNYLDAAYALDSIVQHQLELDNDKNIVYVNYARDSIGKNPESSDDPSDIAVPDGVPDKYQVVEIFSIENGVWDEETGYDGEIADIYTLWKYDDATEKWVALTGEDVPTLKVPTGMKPAAGYQQSAEKGEWLKPQPVEGSTVTTGAEYTYSYGNQKDQFTVTVSVENGTVDATLVDGKTTVVYGEDCVLTFTPNTGYTLSSVTADKDSSKTLLNGVFTFTEVKEDHEIAVVYEAGTYGYNVQYFYDGRPGDAPEGAKTTGQGTFGGQSDLTPADFAELTVTGYAFNKLENCTITETAAANIAKVYYTPDTMGDTEDPANKGDGTPDEYQALVTYSIENGTWVEGDKARKFYVFDLCEMDDSGAWLPVEEIPTLEGTVPTGMKPDAAYRQATGQWTPSEPTEETEVTESVDYVFSYGEEQDKFTIGISVTGGKAYPDDTSKTVTYGGSYKVWFVADEGKVLDTVMLTVGEEDPVAVELSDDGSYNFTDVKENRSIEVTFSADEKSTDPDAPDKGDGIPDKYQAAVTFAVVGGVIKDSKDTGKTVYVTLFDDKGGWSAEGKGQLTAEQIPETSGNEGYTVDKGWDSKPLDATITGEKTFTYTYEKGTFGYSIQYYYDGVKGNKEDGNTATFGTTTDVKPTDPNTVDGINYMLGSMEQCEITAVPENNIVRVYYLTDMLGNDGDDPTNPNKPDGIPDLYQVVVTFKAVNGTVDGTNAKTAVVLTKVDEESKPSVSGSVKLSGVPTPQPATGYKTPESGLWSPAAPDTDKPITEDETFIATYVKGQFGYTVQYYYDGAEGNKEVGKTAEFGATVSAECKTTLVYNEKNYALDSITPCTIGTTEASNIVKVYYLSDEKGGVNQNNPDAPDLPDGIPDVYEAIVKFSVTEGTGTVTENRYAVVPLYGEDGKLSASGKGRLTAEQLPQTAPATGYVVPETGFWSPAEPDTSADITGNCEYEYVATYVLGEYAYTIQYYYDGVKGDKVEGSKAEFGSTPGVTPDPTRTYSDKTYAYDSTTLCTIDTVAENNVVKLYYGLDEYGPESLEEGDGIPDSHQAKIVFQIDGGTWDGSDTNDKTCVYTLETLGADGQWTAVAPAPVLSNDLPTGMKPASDNEDKVGGWHLETKPVNIDATTPVTGNATYVYNYEQKFEAEKTAAEDLPDLGEDLLFTITVENKTEAETLTDIVVSENPGNLIVKVDGVELENPVRVYTIETLAAGAKRVLTVAHTVTEADIKNGSYENKATVSCQGAVIELTKEGKTAEVNNGLTTAKTIDKLNTRPTGEGGKYALGDTVRYIITATNTGNQSLSNVKIAEQPGVAILADDPATYNTSCDPSTGVYTATLIGTLAPGAKLTVYAELTVSGEDILAGKVVNEATVSALAADGGTPVEPAEQPKDETAETVPVDAKLDFEKTAKVYDKDSGAEKSEAAPGDKVTYSFYVKNSGNVPQTGVQVKDEKLGYTSGTFELEVGGEKTLTEDYTVTEADILNGSIKNSATVTAEDIEDPESGEPIKTENNANIEVPTEDVKAEFDFTKAFVAEEPAKEYYLAGETVSYALTVTNKGNVSLKNVTVSEQEGMTILPGDGYDVKENEAVIESLAPGATVTVSVSHKLTEEEVLKGTLENVATVKADKITDPKTEEDIKPEAEADNSDAPLGKTTYTVVYKYDGTEGTAPSATAPVKGEGCVEDTTEVTGVPATASYYGVSYALDEVVQTKLHKDAAENIVKVLYAADKLGNDPDDPEKPAKPDGVPDKYQATVTFTVENGYWDNGRDKNQKVIYDLYEQVEGEWKRKETAPTLGTIPAVGEGKSGYPLAYGWTVDIDETTPVTIDATYTYHFGAATVEPIADKTYTGEPIVPDSSEIVVLDEKGQPIDPANYDVTVTDNTDVGEADVTITFKNELSGEIESHFDIVPKQHNDDHDNTKPRNDDPLSDDYNPGDFCATVDSIAPHAYTGEPIKPAVTVRDEKGKALVPDVDYEIVGYENNVDPGEATVKIKLKGNYEGELTTTFEITANGYLIVPPVNPEGKPYEEYEVDGEEDTVEEVGGEELIVRESSDAFVVTGTNYSDGEDPHDKYPTEMTTEILVYNPQTGRFDVVKSYFDLIRYEGCSIRIGTNRRGLRVVSSISREFKDELINEGVELNGKVYRLSEYGTLMAWTKELGDMKLNMERVDEGIAKCGIAFSEKTDALYQQTAERDYWCNVVTSKDGSLSDAQVCSDMTLRPYLVMAADDGSTFYIYGGEVVRSVGSVAIQNQDVYASGRWEDDAIEELIAIYKEKGSEY